MREKNLSGGCKVQMGLWGEGHWYRKVLKGPRYGINIHGIKLDLNVNMGMVLMMSIRSDDERDNKQRVKASNGLKRLLNLGQLIT